MPQPTSRANADDEEPTVGQSGRWVVVGVFAFALSLVGVMWLYLDRHTRPFRPLRQALAQEFEDSAPKVEGGQTRIEKGTPKTLRIIMRVPFNPNKEPDKANEFAHRVARFAKSHHDLGQYDVIEIHLFHPVPEREIEKWSTEIDPTDLTAAAER
jgi:hypothetical protein